VVSFGSLVLTVNVVLLVRFPHQSTRSLMLGVESRRADRSLQEAAYERLDHDSGRLRWILKHGILIDFKGSSCFHSFQAGPACRVATSASSRRCVCWATACSPSTPPPSCPCSSRYGSSGAHMICSEHAVPQMQVAWLCSAAGTLRKSLTPALSAPQSGTHWRLAGPALNAGWANPSTSLKCMSMQLSDPVKLPDPVWYPCAGVS